MIKSYNKTGLLQRIGKKVKQAELGGGLKKKKRYWNMINLVVHTYQVGYNTVYAGI